MGFLLKKDSGPFEQKVVTFLLPEMGIKSRSRAAVYKTHFSGIKYDFSTSVLRGKASGMPEKSLFLCACFTGGLADC